MNPFERIFIIVILATIAVLIGLDILNDAKEGVEVWHILIESVAGTLAFAGVFYLLVGTISLRHQLRSEVEGFKNYKLEADAWRTESRKFIEGLSQAIDLQLSKWKLTGAEKEVAFLLLKGLSLKDIAEVRKTSEKTARAHAVAIYSKAGISGRSELSAFFLEDLLLPTDLPQESQK